MVSDFILTNVYNSDLERYYYVYSVVVFYKFVLDMFYTRITKVILIMMK